MYKGTSCIGFRRVGTYESDKDNVCGELFICRAFELIHASPCTAVNL